MLMLKDLILCEHGGQSVVFLDSSFPLWGVLDISPALQHVHQLLEMVKELAVPHDAPADGGHVACEGRVEALLLVQPLNPVNLCAKLVDNFHVFCCQRFLKTFQIEPLKSEKSEFAQQLDHDIEPTSEPTADIALLRRPV